MSEFRKKKRPDGTTYSHPITPRIGEKYQGRPVKIQRVSRSSNVLFSDSLYDYAEGKLWETYKEEDLDAGEELLALTELVTDAGVKMYKEGVTGKNWTYEDFEPEGYDPESEPNKIINMAMMPKGVEKLGGDWYLLQDYWFGMYSKGRKDAGLNIGE